MEIVEGAVCSEHVHLCVCITPKMSVSQFVRYLKGKSALMIYDKHPELGSKWNKSFWARGYYVATVGNLTEEAIKKYIQEQSEKSKKEDNQGTAFSLYPDIRVWKLDTMLQESGNCHLYEKCGFVRVGEEHVIHEKMTLIDYEKR